jgi:hypothetical protein
VLGRDKPWRKLETFIRGVDHATDLRFECEERNDVLPVLAPHPRDDRQLRPLRLKAVQGEQRLIGIDRGVDRPQVLGDLVIAFARHVFQARSDLMNKACLDGGGREDRLDCLRESFEPVNTGDEDV